MKIQTGRHDFLLKVIEIKEYTMITTRKIWITEEYCPFV